MSEDKRMVGNFEVRQSIYIGNKEVVFGVDKKDPYPFMVCYCDYHSFGRSVGNTSRCFGRLSGSNADFHGTGAGTD